MATIKETIINLFDLDKMEPAKANEMVDRLGKMVFQAVLIRVLPTLSEDDLKEYENIVNSDKEGIIMFNYLNQKVPNFSEIIEEEAEMLRAELADQFGKAGL